MDDDIGAELIKGARDRGLIKDVEGERLGAELAQ